MGISIIIDFFKIIINIDDYFYGIFYPLNDEPILDIVYETIKSNTTKGFKNSIIEGLLQLDIESYNDYIYESHKGSLVSKIFHFVLILSVTIVSSYIINTLYYIINLK